MALELKPTNGLYLAYNKSIAVESSKEFPKSITCSTIHSLAYQNTIKPLRLKVGFFSYRDIQKRMPFEKKILVVETLRKYCLSRFVSIDDYIKHHRIEPLVAETVTKYLGLMKSGSIYATHDFYLKLYHILLFSGSIKHDPFDIIMIDEFGDITGVSLEIFRLLPSPKKVAAGDTRQAIYSFNDTINGFHEMHNEGIHLPLSQSFRCSEPIAERIQAFCRSFMDPKMDFKGMDYTPDQLSGSRTSAFISRTNSALIGEMINLNRLKKPYGLTRPVKSIFELPLGLITLNSKGFIKVPQYKFLEADYADFHSIDGMNQRSFFSHLATTYADDISINTALALIIKHGPKVIIETHDAAKAHEGGNHDHILMTAHSGKGLTIDSVYIANDMTQKLKKMIQSKSYQRDGYDGLTIDEQSEFLLAYVAASRARYSLENADFLEWTADIDFENEEFEAQLHNHSLDEL